MAMLKKRGGFRVGLDLGYTVPSMVVKVFILDGKPNNIKDNIMLVYVLVQQRWLAISNLNNNNTTAKISANGSYVGTYMITILIRRIFFCSLRWW
jgi:outer membrane protein X